MTHILTEDVKSNRNNTFHGQKGTHVNIVSDRGDAVIVIDISNKIFPVKNTQIEPINKL